ncbi:ribosome biogenesis/translation initiation ATPase RLI [Candidatus Woesearchaeota archaeon]|nr:ribosome biogenesis/translation initiation ATPase RLI [Candidatus Woesearchaeota archaeon]
MAKRIAIVEREKCHPTKCGNYWCKFACPVNREGDACIGVGEDKKVVIDEQLCIGCGICVKCPFDALKIINLPERLRKDPLFRYGKNQFELFSLPLPKKNTLVGIIGRNGIGKSTALSILSNEVVPNFGDYTMQGSQEMVIKHFSTNVLGDYFSALYGGALRVAYKPQRIELLPEVYNGKVSHLLEKVDERGIVGELIESLSLSYLQDREIKELSGGELQRLAIAATLARKADFYFFDEPASFLDILQRIKAANIIRKYTAGASAIIVEHDLATLDYLSDEIQIIYGEGGAYGVVSQSKGVRRGINEYLDGYLPDDNVRFRDYAISFKQSLAPNTVQREIKADYPDFNKSFSSFSLSARGGSLHRGEVLCIMGANGLGKTTFLRVLSGLEQADDTGVSSLKITYKPQYLQRPDGKVGELLIAFAGERFSSGWYKQNILEKLHLSKILENDVATLSGGELQKFAVALTLSQDADLYAFDEPSAFIDVEDRLSVAEVIKEFVTKYEAAAIVVDHDIQFVDYLADSLLVFEGTPGSFGKVAGPVSKEEGMNRVLRMLDITYRRDKLTHRPRINKPGSQLDTEQRREGKHYATA